LDDPSNVLHDPSDVWDSTTLGDLSRYEVPLTAAIGNQLLGLRVLTPRGEGCGYGAA
jgi:hypothetical protein